MVTMEITGDRPPRYGNIETGRANGFMKHSRIILMKIFRFITHQTIERQLPEVFAFFSDAHNLATITPPWLRFEVLTPAPIVLQVGTQIDYRLKLRGIPLRWQSEITAWHPPQSFTDEQRRGPYRLWRHTHTFEETAAGTVVGDEVEYAVWGGSAVNTLFVRRDIAKIFAYRAEKLDELFHRKNNNPR